MVDEIDLESGCTALVVRFPDGAEDRPDSPAELPLVESLQPNSLPANEEDDGHSKDGGPPPGSVDSGCLNVVRENPGVDSRNATGVCDKDVVSFPSNERDTRTIAPPGQDNSGLSVKPRLNSPRLHLQVPKNLVQTHIGSLVEQPRSVQAMPQVKALVEGPLKRLHSSAQQESQVNISRAAMAEDQRRKDAIYSRGHSRTISRGDGVYEPSHKGDVAEAAAKKLEELSYTTNHSDSHPRPIGTPAVLCKTHQEVDELVRADERRRAAAVASRIHSRVVSRGGISRDGIHAEQRVDVVEAAAERLRKINESGPKHVGHSDSHSRSVVPPSVLRETQQGVEEMVLAEKKQRAAAIASRTHSRVVSRGGISRDGFHADQRVDVVEAAAEKLRILQREGRPDSKSERRITDEAVSSVVITGSGLKLLRGSRLHGEVTRGVYGFYLLGLFLVFNALLLYALKQHATLQLDFVTQVLLLRAA